MRDNVENNCEKTRKIATNSEKHTHTHIHTKINTYTDAHTYIFTYKHMCSIFIDIINIKKLKFFSFF